MPEWSRVSSAGGPFGIYRKRQNAYTRISSVRHAPKKDGTPAEAQYAPTACPVRQKKDDRQAATSSRAWCPLRDTVTGNIRRRRTVDRRRRHGRRLRLRHCRERTIDSGRSLTRNEARQQRGRRWNTRNARRRSDVIRHQVSWFPFHVL